MMRHIVLVLLIALAVFIWLPTSLLAPYILPTLPPIPSVSFRLSNGMQVVLIEHKKLPAVAHMVWYKVGAAQEQDGKTGLAHFLEHMMFQGTDKHPNDSFSHIIALHGGDQNAFTSHDYTGYYQYIAKEYLPLVMELESERMHGIDLSLDAFTNERDVIMEERRMRVENNPRSILREIMRHTIFPDHSYGNPVIGWPEDISAITLEDAKQFYDNYYSPQNAILVIVGDIDPESLKPLIERYYGSLPVKPNSISRETPRDVHYEGPQFVNHRDKHVKTPELIRYYIAPSRHTDNKEYSYALELLAYYLGGSDTSMLYQSLVRDKGLASYVSSYYSDISLGKSIFAIHVLGKENSSIKELENALDQELSHILTHSIPAKDLQRIQSMLYSSSIYSRDSFKYIAQLYGYVLASDLPISYIDTWPQRIIDVSADDISKAANFVLKPSGLLVGTLVPEHYERK